MWTTQDFSRQHEGANQDRMFGFNASSFCLIVISDIYNIVIYNKRYVFDLDLSSWSDLLRSLEFSK